MRLLLLFTYTLLFVHCIQAQKEANNWYFGKNAGVTFNTDPPSALINGKINTREGCASFSDKNGNLLFYTDGVKVWDSTNTMMPNGNGLHGDLTTTQSALIVPHPDSINIYYIFTVAAKGSENGLQYSRVDMNLNSGKGDIPLNEKNIKLMSPSCEKVAAVKKDNGKEYWILALQYKSDNLLAYSIDKNGLNHSPIINKTSLFISDKQSSNTVGYLKFSSDGKKIGFNNSQLGYTLIADFNNSNATISNIWKFNTNLGYGLEFSPKSQFLYLTEEATTKIFQYDMRTNNMEKFINSRIVIDSCLSSIPYALQIGPNQKIYVSYRDFKFLSVIHSPDSLGFSCRPQHDYIYLEGKTTIFGLPNYISSLFLNKLNLWKDTIICLKHNLIITCNIKGSIKWNTGDTSHSILIQSPGIYSSEIKTRQGYLPYYKFKITISDHTKLIIGNDTTFCNNFSFKLKSSVNSAKYNWNTGENDREIIVKKEGQYILKVTDSNTCFSIDTINIKKIAIPNIKLNYDSIDCKYIDLFVDSLIGLKYRWNTNENSSHIKVQTKGLYIIETIHPFCSNKDSIYVNQLSQPEVNLGIDTSLCNYELKLNTTEIGSYLWSTGETRPFILVNEPGKYSLTVSRNNCNATDTVNVKLCEEMNHFVPNAFSPNDDNINDIFKVYGSSIAVIEMEIFNRWGELIYKSTGKDPSWDGTYKNSPCMESIYFYRLFIKGKKAGTVANLKGSLTLIR